MNSSSLGIDKFENKGMELNECGRNESESGNGSGNESENGSGNVTFFISIEAGWDYEVDGMGRSNGQGKKSFALSLNRFLVSLPFSILELYFSVYVCPRNRLDYPGLTTKVFDRRFDEERNYDRTIAKVRISWISP